MEYEATDVIRNAIKDYGLISFNGGKDCTVLLDLYHKEWKKHSKSDEFIHAIYIVPSEPFIEVENFIDDCVVKYQLDLIRLKLPMKVGLCEYLKLRPNIKGIFVGVRRSDPSGTNLQLAMRTDVDKGWPDFMRFHPLLNWTYHDIWNYLLTNDIPYCKLYDHGYTSLGDKTKTYPNPSLRTNGTFLSAAELKQETHERLGRIKDCHSEYLFMKD